MCKLRERLCPFFFSVQFSTADGGEAILGCARGEGTGSSTKFARTFPGSKSIEISKREHDDEETTTTLNESFELDVGTSAKVKTPSECRTRMRACLCSSQRVNYSGIVPKSSGGSRRVCVPAGCPPLSRSRPTF